MQTPAFAYMWTNTEYASEFMDGQVSEPAKLRHEFAFAAHWRCQWKIWDIVEQPGAGISVQSHVNTLFSDL